MMKISTEKFLKATKSLPVLLVRDEGCRKYADKTDAFRKGEDKREFYPAFCRADEYGMGFYAWALGASGWYTMVPYDQRPYRGFEFSPNAILACDADMEKPCLCLQGSLWMRQGMSDFLLARRAEILSEQARKQGVECSDVNDILADLRKQAREGLPYRGYGDENLAKTRLALMQALSRLTPRVKSK